MDGNAGRYRPLEREVKGKASFCEQKEAKKLYLCWAMGVIGDNARGPA
jgi:hypothetical protein